MGFDLGIDSMGFQVKRLSTSFDFKDSTGILSSSKKRHTNGNSGYPMIWCRSLAGFFEKRVFQKTSENFSSVAPILSGTN